jgi:uncharacterized protein (DUF4415 family)
MKSSGSSRHGEQRGTNAVSTRARLVNGALVELPEPTKLELNQLRALNRRPDSEIDFSDIPEITPEMWRKAIRGNPYLPKKQQLTVRLDADVLAWLKGMGKGYQTKLNAMLRAAMKASHAK